MQQTTVCNFVEKFFRKSHEQISAGPVANTTLVPVDYTKDAASAVVGSCDDIRDSIITGAYRDLIIDCGDNVTIVTTGATGGDQYRTNLNMDSGNLYDKGGDL